MLQHRGQPSKRLNCLVVLLSAAALAALPQPAAGSQLHDPARLADGNSCLADAACCAAWGPAVGPWYVSLGGAWQQRETVHEAENHDTFLRWDHGFTLQAAVGRQFGAWRLEGEFSLMNNGVREAGAGIPNVGNFVSDAEGNVSLRAYMLNVYRDFEIPEWRVAPYAGAGIGIYQSEINSLRPEFFDGLGMPTMGVNSTSDFPLAYQFRGGLNYRVSPRTTLFGGYRYFRGEKLTFAAEPFGVFHPDGAAVHGLEGGLRVNF